MGLFWYFFGFSGRTTRLNWWIGQLVGNALAFAAGFGAGAVIGPEAATLTPETAMAQFWTLLPFLAVMLLVMWINLSVCVRRYHDRDKAGWWAMLPGLPVLVFPAMGFTPLSFALAALGVAVLAIWQLIELGLLAGSPESNDYGDPSGPTGSSSAVADEIAALKQAHASYAFGKR